MSINYDITFVPVTHPFWGAFERTMHPSGRNQVLHGKVVKITPSQEFVKLAVCRIERDGTESWPEVTVRGSDLVRLPV